MKTEPETKRLNALSKVPWQDRNEARGESGPAESLPGLFSPDAARTS